MHCSRPKGIGGSCTGMHRHSRGYLEVRVLYGTIFQCNTNKRNFVTKKLIFFSVKSPIPSVAKIELTPGPVADEVNK
jgi:hypothetical protein